MAWYPKTRRIKTGDYEVFMGEERVRVWRQKKTGVQSSWGARPIDNTVFRCFASKSTAVEWAREWLEKTVHFPALEVIEADYLDEFWDSGKPFTIAIKDEPHDDIAQIFSCEDSTVSTTRRQAYELACLFARAPSLVSKLKRLRDSIHACNRNPIPSTKRLKWRDLVDDILKQLSPGRNRH